MRMIVGIVAGLAWAGCSALGETAPVEPSPVAVRGNAQLPAVERPPQVRAEVAARTQETTGREVEVAAPGTPGTPRPPESAVPGALPPELLRRVRGTIARCTFPASGMAITPDGRVVRDRRCQTPLVLVFEAGQSVQVRADDGRGRFDLSAEQDGRGERTGWPTAATPWLAMDRDGDGRITSGRELFGSATLLGDGTTAADGFAALAELDADRDGDVDADDPGFGDLMAWSDDGDRRSEPHELRSLVDVGVVALELAFARVPRCDALGNCEIERSALRLRDGAGAVVDLHLVTGLSGEPR